MPKSVQLLLAATFLGSTTFATAEDIPAWCCPLNCEATDGPVKIGATSVTVDLSRTGTGVRTTPISQNVFKGQSPDEKTHLCFGYTDFGNEEIKCILTPVIM